LEAEGTTASASSAAPTAAATTATPTASPASPALTTPPKHPMDATMVMPRGVSLDQLEQGGRKPGFDTASTVFKKKRNKTAQYFWIAAGIGVFIIIVLIIVVLSSAKNNH
jgi:hypothetical protein